MKNFKQYLQRVQSSTEYGNEFDSSALNPKFRKYYGTNTRVKVKANGKVVSGTIDVSVGWKPSFILKSKSGEIKLDSQHKIIGLSMKENSK